MFGFDGSSWAQDAADTKSLAMDGFFVSLFNLRIDRRSLTLSDHVINSVPSLWDPAALARFIVNFGTHIIVGLGVGGQDVVYVRQDQSSKLSPSEIKQHLDKLGEELITGSCAILPLNWKSKEPKLKVPEAFNVFDAKPSNVGSFTTVSHKDVTVERNPVTGMRLHIEGKKNNRLAVHLEHLSNTPEFIGGLRPNKVPLWQGSDAATTEEGYYEPVTRKKFSHVCTVPVEHELHTSSAFIVTGAQLHVKDHESTSVLHLKLQFSEVTNCVISQSKWECGHSGFSHKSLNFLSTIVTSSSTVAKEKQQQQQAKVVILDSEIFHKGPPVPVQDQKLLRFVDTSQICMGPHDSPVFWLVTGAKLDLQKGKIGLNVKFSLLTDILTQDSKSI